MSGFRYSAGFAVIALAAMITVVDSGSAAAQGRGGGGGGGGGRAGGGGGGGGGGGRGGAASQPAAAPDASSASACNIDETKPKEVAAALVSFQQASVATGDTKLKHIRAVMKSAETNIGKGENLPARYELMGKAIVTFLSDSTAPTKTTRGNLGLTIEPTKEVDLFVAVDSLFKAVVAAAPGCADEVDPLRQNTAWLMALRAGEAALAAGQTDSAEAYVRRAAILTPTSPYIFHYLGAIENAKGDRVAEEAAWRSLLAAAPESDTSNAALRLEAVQYLAQATYMDVVFETDSVKRQASIQKAVDAARAYLALGDKATEANAVRGMLAAELQVGNRISEIPTLYADLLADPSKFSGQDLFQMGLIAQQIDSSAQSIKLFEAAEAKLPYERDLLYALGTAYGSSRDHSKMLPVVRRLYALDPENPDNLQLLGFAFSVQDTTGKDAAARKAFADSATYYTNESAAMKHAVTVQSLKSGPQGTTLMGSVANSDAADKTFTLHFELLDNQGAVVASQDAVVQGKAMTATPFTISATQGNIVGWRYKPFPK